MSQPRFEPGFLSRLTAFGASFMMADPQSPTPSQSSSLSHSEPQTPTSTSTSTTVSSYSATIHTPQGSVYDRIRSWLLQDASAGNGATCNGQAVTRKAENVRMLERYSARSSLVGCLYLTNTHLVFIDPSNKKEVWILLMHVASVEKLPLTTLGSPLQIRCKTFLSVTFVIPKERECLEIHNGVQKLSQPVQIEQLYCFSYKCPDIPQPAGWNFFDLQDEFQRMKVPGDEWSCTLLNKDYELCDTYPRYLYVPAHASSSILLGSSRFRSKGRLPVLTYLHPNKASLCRCSQPLSGFKARCLEDEQMLNCILRTNPNSKYMYVVDTRPRINAMANRAAGKGYENESFYENIKFNFLGIENIHVMRTSLAKLIETCELANPNMNSFLSGLESSGWLRHIKSALDTSWFMADAINRGVSVVVHCSDGWDRTAQVCSLAALMLDPYYRTTQGYQALIEKDWLAFGHKFSERIGHIAGDPKEISPVFTQFIDCTWQLTQQHPAAFQFNERFLLALHDHAASCRYGTFIGNCEKDRLDLRLNERTYSLWGYIANQINDFMNPLYEEDAYQGLLVPNLAPQNIRFWRGLYCRFENGVHPRESLTDLLIATRDHSSSLEDHIRLLQKRIEHLKYKLNEAGIPGKKSCDNQEMDNKYCFEQEMKLQKTAELQEKGDNVPDLSDIGLVKNPIGLNNGLTHSLSVNQLSAELDSVALDWKTLRNIKQCSCSTPFSHFSEKYHCWKCGEVFCTRCIDKHTALPGHLSQRAVPVCRPCFRAVHHSNSIESP